MTPVPFGGAKKNGGGSASRLCLAACCLVLVCCHFPAAAKTLASYRVKLEAHDLAQPIAAHVQPVAGHRNMFLAQTLAESSQGSETTSGADSAASTQAADSLNSATSHSQLAASSSNPQGAASSHASTAAASSSSSSRAVLRPSSSSESDSVVSSGVSTSSDSLFVLSSSSWKVAVSSEALSSDSSSDSAPDSSDASSSSLGSSSDTSISSESVSSSSGDSVSQSSSFSSKSSSLDSSASSSSTSSSSTSSIITTDGSSSSDRSRSASSDSSIVLTYAVTRLISMVYSGALQQSASAIIGSYSAAHGVASIVTEKASAVHVEDSTGYWQQADATSTSPYSRSFLSVTTDVGVLDAFTAAANSGRLEGVVRVESWEDRNGKSSKLWIIGIVIAAVVAIAAEVLIVLQIVYKQRHRKQRSSVYSEGAYDDLEMSNARNNAAGSDAGPANSAPPLPVRERNAKW